MRNVLKKILILFLGAYVFFLYRQNMLPTVEMMQKLLNLHGSQLSGVMEQKGEPSTAQTGSKQIEQHTVSQPQAVSTIRKMGHNKYPIRQIQTYRVTVENGNLVITGKPTPYGQFYQAEGVILYIQETRANKMVTIKVPFQKGRMDYKYPLTYTVGDVVLNLDEYYKGKANDPNTVLGYAQFHLTDGNPFLLPSYMVQSNNPAIQSLARSITRGKYANAEKSRAIFEWVAKNISYNAPLVNAVNPPVYSALQTYKSRVVLCTGYADLSAALHRAIGIEAKVSYGDNHAWDEIKLNGKWQAEDPTYGSGFINASTNEFVSSYHPAYFYKTDMHKEGVYPW